MTEQQINCETKLEKRRLELVQWLSTIKDPNQIVFQSKGKSLFLQMRSQRSSQYRGVSRNGTKWQVMVVNGEMRKYIGAVQSQEQAARYYDKYSIIMSGEKVSPRL